MRPIPKNHQEKIDQDLFFKKCARCEEGNCRGRITIEHALIFAGKQICEMWNYIPLCEYHHAVNNYQDGGDFDKEISVWISLNRAQEHELKQYSKAINYVRERSRLNDIYGFPQFDKANP